MGRESYHHGNLRQALVDATVGLIEEKGPMGFTLAEAARLAGVSAAAPYRHFAGRDELLTEVARQGFHDFAQRLEAAFDSGKPTALSAFLRLGQAYLDLLHPDWALATTAQFAGAGDHRIHLVRATAFAERLQAKACVDESARGLAACDAEGPRCSPAERVRFDVISSAMQALVDQSIDPQKDPKRAREAVGAVLHATKASAKPPR